MVQAQDPRLEVSGGCEIIGRQKYLKELVSAEAK